MYSKDKTFKVQKIIRLCSITYEWSFLWMDRNNFYY